MSERIKCKQHPRYALKRKPRSKCRTCWALWLIENYFTLQATEEDVKAVCDLLDAFERKKDD